MLLLLFAHCRLVWSGGDQKHNTLRALFVDPKIKRVPLYLAKLVNTQYYDILISMKGSHRDLHHYYEPEKHSGGS
jgi:hypothetical protein